MSDADRGPDCIARPCRIAARCSSARLTPFVRRSRDRSCARWNLVAVVPMHVRYRRLEMKNRLAVNQAAGLSGRLRITQLSVVSQMQFGLFRISATNDLMS
jgi:hypothetical protein